MVTVGIDLASQPKGTAVCRIQWRLGIAEVLSIQTGAGDDDLLQAIEGADKVGIDVPFGWPIEFVRAVEGHTNAGRWPPEAPNPGKSPKLLQYRETDRFVHRTTGRWPLSVSADRIAIPAMRAAALFARIASGGQPVARDGSGKIAEVYPAAALRVWGLRPEAIRYKGPAGDSGRQEILAGLRRDAQWLFLDADATRQCAAGDDALDALIGSLTARATAMDLCEPVPPDLRAAVACEGWIAVPKVGSLSELI
jgi:hypothetical protein